MSEQLAPGRPPSRAAFYRIGWWSARHPWLVALLWLGLLVGATAGHRALGGVYSDDFSLSGTPAQNGAALLQANHVPPVGGPSGQLVFTVTSGSLARDRTVIDRSMARVRALPHVVLASNPLSPGTTSASGRTAYSTLYFSASPVTLGPGYVSQFDQAVAAARQAGVGVSYGGLLGQAARPPARDGRSEGIGIAVALLVLLIGFGSVYAAGLPVLSALLGAFTGLGLLGLLAAATTFATVAPTVAIMMGLGVGIDYALFLTTRHRQLVMDGADPVDAAGRSLATSGRAVLTAAVTVVIALLGLYASGITFIGKLGLAAALTVAVAALGALTLAPALLGLAGRRIDRLRVRPPAAESAAGHPGWQRYAERVGAHPWRYLGAGVVLLGVLAIPVFSLQLGHVGAGADPPGYTDKQAYDQISAAFGPGANGPFTVVAQLSQPASPARLAALEAGLHRALAAVPDVAKVSPVRAAPDGALLVAIVRPRTGPQAAATGRLMDTIQQRTLPTALAGAGSGDVTGTLAGQLQFSDLVSSRLPVIILTVIAAAFLLLLLTFRSPVLALKAALLNLLSIGAAYGVIVAVFQWGWGSSLVGVSERVPIESYVPMMMFAVVFGLSMDYEVFLLSRVREAWIATRDNHVSVSRGLAATARVITCAALIMTAVFLSFLLSDNVVVKMFALGLGASVIIDATVIRLVVVPATMFLLGRLNWWTPRWLDRALPRPEPVPPVPDLAPAGRGAAR
jgi:putative drug exporter of the RND superfamily